jgi:hypothetical protein
MDPPGAHFCCNQVVHYISQIDVFVWLLQYTSSTRDNFLRLAFAKTRDVILGRWRIYDINSELLSLKAAYLTSPDLAVGANYLYVTANVHGDEPLGTAIVRCPFNGIESGEITAEHFVSTHVHSFRMAQNCSTTAFFAAHETTSSMLVFSWEESQGKPTATTVNVATWIGGSGYESQTPDGRRWLDRIDPRITGATLAGDELWFAWTVDKGTDHRRHPFVRIARISCRGMKLIENMDVFEEHSAVCYPALSTNATSEVGMACVMGGGPRFPSHVVGILTGTRQEVLVAAGDRGPVPDPHTGRGEWGTFLTIRPVLPDRRLFAATGYTLKGKKDGKNRDATPRLVIFGRAGDIMPALSVVGAIGTVRGAGRIHRNGDRRDRR